MKIENIVCSGSFNQVLDLKLLSKDDHVEYGKNKYPGAYIKFNGHSVTLYRTGKYIMPGMRSFDDVRQTFEDVKCVLSPYVDVSKFSYPEVRNIVCSSQCEEPLNLNIMFIEMLSHDLDVIYEPEAFPGLIYKTEECTFNIFQSGKFLILGCTSEEQAVKCEQNFFALIKTLSI